jgi:hypothetical protein
MALALSRTNLGLALAAAVLLYLQSVAVGTVSTNNGLGWDGEDYARMLETGVEHGTPNTRLRPLIVLLARPVLSVVGDPISAFRVMNVLYAAVLAWAMASLADAYGASRSSTIYLVATLGLSISTAGMFAYYPVLVDLGAYAFFALALLALVRGRWIASGVLLGMAALSREFVVALLAFAVVRVVRTVRPWTVTARVLAGTVAPALATTLALRTWSTMVDGRPSLGVGRLLANVALWADPWFVALFISFLITIFGGVSAIILVRWRPVMAVWRAEWEWFAYVATVVAFSAVGDADIWRYLAYLVPAAATLFGRCVDGVGARTRWALLGVGGAVTVATQQPFRVMSLDRYFGEWFPYYILSGRMQVPQSVCHVWVWRMSSLLVAVLLLALISHAGLRALRCTEA